MLVTKQLVLARRALGLPNDRMRSYRNYFLCGSAEHEDFADWDEMEHAGLAVSIGRKTNRLVFGMTYEGAKLALAPGESLDQDDFLEAAL